MRSQWLRYQSVSMFCIYSKNAIRQRTSDFDLSLIITFTTSSQSFFLCQNVQGFFFFFRLLYITVQYIGDWVAAGLPRHFSMHCTSVRDVSKSANKVCNWHQLPAHDNLRGRTQVKETTDITKYLLHWHLKTRHDIKISSFTRTFRENWHNSLV